jgi:uncharacterized flavoprotein (TIGR03862 family)
MSGEGRGGALVIGGGPAGLMAAETLARAGLPVTLAEAMPSLGRKFLMAGKSGLNLTMDEPPGAFRAAFTAPAPLARAFAAFGPAEVRAFAEDLGQAVFTGSTGRVFPVAMKASPLLRAWLGRLADLGVRAETRWRWVGGAGAGFDFATPQGERRVEPAVTVLALGGASWRRLGSDGAWAGLLAERGIELVPFAASNAGLAVDWPAPMARLFGTPVKGTAIVGGGRVFRGEYVISARGLEGGGIYALSPLVRAGTDLAIDLMPDWTFERIAARLARPRGKASQSNHLRKALRLDPARLGLLRSFAHPLPEGPALAALVKALPLRHGGLRPMDEAISTVGGVAAGALDPRLMLRDWPGVFVAGEMIDWDAPTGGYLISGCLASGLWAGRHAAAFARAGEA